MPSRWTALGRGSVLAALGLGVDACLVRHVEIREVSRQGETVAVASPVKAHLLDGQTVVYAGGVTVTRDSLIGGGERFDLRLVAAGTVSSLPLDSVVGLESFRTKVDAVPSVILSTLAVVGTAAAAVAIACAIDPKCFGSCPTFYADSGDAAVLEAEGFSYSIAPLFEARDVDRLRTRTDGAGAVRLEVRNEAYETHYLNQLALLEARHGPGEFVLPDGDGHVLAVAGLVPPAVARDAAGRDLRRPLTWADGEVVRSDAPRSLEDTIELSFPASLPGDSVALVFRMRNSLLNTVLLYDAMLGDGGARSLDWQASTLQQIGPALQLGQWYASRMGMRISVWRDGAWHEETHLRDTGPVAWKDIAAVVPRPAGSGLRVRLTYVADNWRIDRVAAAFSLRRPGLRTWAASRVVDATGRDDSAALASVRDADQRYLETTAGQRFTIVWQPAAVVADSQRTFLLVSQGYYIEWIRRGWLREPTRPTPFAPGEAALADVVARYRAVRDTLERRFFATRVPVR